MELTRPKQLINLYHLSNFLNTMRTPAFNYPSLVRGTMISMDDGTTKPIESINYSDEILVWDFDTGFFDKAKPLWIKTETYVHTYNQLKFNDGTTLNIAGQQTIFNYEMGEFLYPVVNNKYLKSQRKKFKKVDLLSNRTVNKPEITYSIITDHHMNFFANNILTSIKHNNIYPIENMKFIKIGLPIMPIMHLNQTKTNYIDGLRLSEQSEDSLEEFINTLIYLKV
jgi:hypothetical protein